MVSLESFLADQPELKTKVLDLTRKISDFNRVAVAFSGGVDSALLLKIASHQLGQNCMALIGTSPSFPPQEKREAIALAEQMGVTYEIVETSEMQDPSYVENSPQRCYYCRIHSMDDLLQRAKRLGFDVLVDGTNADDTQDHRPGYEAAKQLGIKSPFLEVGMTKEDIRHLARILNLTVWNKPASACLASRIPYGTSITIEALKQINLAENVLKDLGFSNVRVRHYDELARIELLPQEFEHAIQMHQKITHSMKELGYIYITLDLDGLRSGSMNLVFSNDESYGSR
jgi:uncharacterized protein